jgi:YHS domain-containing protein
MKTSLAFAMSQLALVCAAIAAESAEPRAPRTERLGAAIPAGMKAVPVSKVFEMSQKWQGKALLLEGRIEKQCGNGAWFWVVEQLAAEKQGATTVTEAPVRRIYVHSPRLPIAPRIGRKVRVLGTLTVPASKEKAPSIDPLGIEVLPPDPKPWKNVWKCGCTGKTWEQKVEEAKTCPYCGSAMPDCGTLQEVITAVLEEPQGKPGCSGCKQGEGGGGCGCCGESAGSCSETGCKKCRGDDPDCAGCSPLPAEGAPLKAQTRCPVMGGAINKSIFTDHDGLRVYFCCESCIETFKSDPEKYLKKMKEAGEWPEKG